jgi:hypothetical protein
MPAGDIGKSKCNRLTTTAALFLKGLGQCYAAPAALPAPKHAPGSASLSAAALTRFPDQAGRAALDRADGRSVRPSVRRRPGGPMVVTDFHYGRRALFAINSWKSHQELSPQMTSRLHTTAKRQMVALAVLTLGMLFAPRHALAQG